jgi:hypothetical protein
MSDDGIAFFCSNGCWTRPGSTLGGMTEAKVACEKDAAAIAADKARKKRCAEILPMIPGPHPDSHKLSAMILDVLDQDVQAN